MTSGVEGEWVRQGTPRDDSADWNSEQSEYGTAISPAEWDDYSSEQSVPVAAPRPQVPEGTATAGSPGSPAEQDVEPVPGQDSVSEEEYRPDENDAVVEDDLVGDTGSEPAPVGDTAHAGATAAVAAPVSPIEDDPMTHYSPDEVPDQEPARPRPIVPDASMAAAGAAWPTDGEDPTDPVTDTGTPEHMQSPGDEASAHGDDDAFVGAPEAAEERHVEAADYLAVDPVAPPRDLPGASSSDDATDRDADAHDDAAEDEPLAEDTVAMEGSPESEDGSHDPEDTGREPSPLNEVDEGEATQVVPLVDDDAAASADTASTVPEGLYRADGMENTAVIEEESYPDVDEEERLQARLEAERQARDQRLGAVPTSPENASREDTGPARITTDRFLPSFGLFVLRIVTAGILGVTSWQILGSGVDETATFLGGYPLIPEPRLVAWILGFTLGAMALLLVIGLLQRVVGVLLLAISAASLALIRWGSFSIFRPGAESFIGDRDLLLAAVGLLLLGMGGGKWGVDGAFRGARAAAKAERED